METLIRPAIAIIQARMSSSRLPGKVLKPLAEKPMIWHIAERARACRHVDRVVVATSVEAGDDPLAEYCAEAGIDCHRGPLDDVLGRYLEVLERFPHAYYVRITGDCPLIHPDFIDFKIRALSSHQADMGLVVGESPWPAGPGSLLEGQGVHSTQSLLTVAARSTHPDDREHVGSRYFAERPDEFQIIGLKIPDWMRDTRWRLTVDEEADYRLMSAIYEALWDGHPIPLDKVVAWLADHPEIAAGNQKIQHKPVNRELHARRTDQARRIRRIVDWKD